MDLALGGPALPQQLHQLTHRHSAREAVGEFMIMSGQMPWSLKGMVLLLDDEADTPFCPCRGRTCHPTPAALSDAGGS